MRLKLLAAGNGPSAESELAGDGQPGRLAEGHLAGELRNRPGVSVPLARFRPPPAAAGYRWPASLRLESLDRT